MLQTQGVIDEYSSMSPSDGDLALDKALKLQHQAIDKYVGMCRSVTKSMLKSALPDNGRFVKFIQDIERQRTDELNLIAIVNASDDAIIRKTLNGTIMSWNKGAEKIYGYKAAEILGQPISVLIPPGHPNPLPEIMRLQRGGRIQSFETTQMHKDGHLIDVSVTISPVKNKSGMVVGASVVARDITERKRAEAAMRLSEERLRVALKGAPVVVFTQDLELRYTWIHSPFLAWENQSIGHTDAEIVSGEEGARLTAIKQEVLRTGVGSRTEISVTFEGVMHYFDLVVEPLWDTTGTLMGVICSATDTTSSKNVIARLQEALNEVQLLSGMLPICASCKKIKDELEVWQPLERYIQAHSGAKFSHGLCPDCLRKLYPDFYT
jgi:PAS domain S-box-containing protein